MSHILYVVTVDVSPAAEEAWSSWHDQRQVPEILKQPGFLGARRYIEPSPLTDGWFRYVILYEIDSPAALARFAQSDVAGHLRLEHNQRFGDVTRTARRVLHEVHDLAAQDPYEGI
jgi:uncharacterized protein DUF4286